MYETMLYEVQRLRTKSTFKGKKKIVVPQSINLSLYIIPIN